MILNKQAKIEKCVSTDEARTALNHLMVFRGDELMFPGMDSTFGRMVATNGRMLVSIPVTLEDEDVPGMITPESLSYARRHTINVDDKTAVHLSLDSEKSVVADNGGRFPRSVVARMDNKGELIGPDPEDKPNQYPSAAALEMIVPCEAPVGVVTLNPTLLKKLADAMGAAEAVTLSFYKKNKAVVRVDGKGEIEDAFAILCCIREGDQCGFELK